MVDTASALTSFQLDLFDNLDAADSSDLIAVDSIEIFATDETAPIDTLYICSQYLASLQDKKDINDTKNALIRYFVPGVGGPTPSAKKHKSISLSEFQQGFEFLKTVPLNILSNAPDIVLSVLEKLDSSPSQRERVRHSLRGLVEWAQKQAYLELPENPIPAGACSHIKVGLFEGLNLKPANARQILEQYLEQIEDQEVTLDTSNAIIRFFVPACGGPLPHHKPALDIEVEAGLQYLETIPLEYLNESPAIATVALDALGLTLRHGTRIRNALRDLIKWAVAEQYLPKPNSVAPWGGDISSQEMLGVVVQEEQQTLFEYYEEYCRHLEQIGRSTELNALRTAIIRYFVPGCGGPAPVHTRATANEVQAALAYLKTVPLNQLSNGTKLTETEFDRLNVPLEKRRSIRSRLRAWFNWAMERNGETIEGKEFQPVFNTFYTNGVKREYKKPGMELHEKRCPVHALCAKQFPDDYLNDGLKEQLNTYKQWRRDNDVTPGALTTEEEQILQVLGWLHRYESIPLSELSFEHLITRNKLVFWAFEYSSYEEYLMRKEIGIQEARKRADEDKERVERYLAFTGENPNSRSRRLFIALSIAKFLYRDVLGSDDYPEDRDIPILRRLLDIQADLKKKGKATQQTVKYSETSTSWEQLVRAMEKERQRADLVTIYVRNSRMRQGYKTQRRPDTAIANDLQCFLSIAFCIIIPSRSRTFYDLRIGETFKEGVLTKLGLLSIQDLQKQGLWEQYKDEIRFYIHHEKEDFKVGKSMTPALLESEGWWAEITNISFGNTCLYDYIRRWLEWGRAMQGTVPHNFFFRKERSPGPMEVCNWNSRIKTIFERWTGVPVSPKNVRKIFTSEFPEYTESAALLLQHSERMHMTHYDMRQTVDKMRPVMEANEGFIYKTLSSIKAIAPGTA
ncbi:hypothetical protein NDI45_24300 [Leptolyngbya sp. GB1-A1]|uniref:hypothetical protein n=1 Tax=Leptolyngbya sp. GB1-A1 TaxID=2933908 RepID=UPI00329A1F40